MIWYVRIGHGPRRRITSAFGSPEFEADYHAALRGDAAPAPDRVKTGTLAWLVDRYRDSSAWLKLSMATRRQRENILKHILASAGTAPFADIDRRAIIAGRERRKHTPAAARHFIETMRGLFRWALDAELVSADPTRDVDVPKQSTEGHPVWSEDEIARFEAHWPTGTRERLAFDILLLTGFRRGDAVRLGRQHMRDGVIRIATEKTGEFVTIPVLPALAESIAATRTGDMMLIVTEHGKPMTKESLGNWFRTICDAAGCPGSAHGLRKAAATRFADNGASVAQMEAWFGWRGGGMAALYTRKADRARLALSAADRLLSAQDANAYSRTPASGAGKSPKNKG